MTDDENEKHQPPQMPVYRNPDAGLTDLIHDDRALARPVAGTIEVNETGLGTGDSGTWEIEQGVDVLCRDGEKIGEVVDVMPGYMVLEQGFFHPRDIYVPIGLIARHDDEDTLRLSITRDEFEKADWTHEPDPPQDEAAGEQS